MKTLLILRHAKSSWNDPSMDDHDRPLNNRGKRDAPRVGVVLKEKNLIPDAILSSTARRAQETSREAARASGFKKEIQFVPDFYPGTPNDYIHTLNNLPDQVNRVMVVGHNPGLEGLLTTLTRIREELPTATLVHLELPIEKWNELTSKTKANLIFIWRPKEND